MEISKDIFNCICTSKAFIYKDQRICIKNIMEFCWWYVSEEAEEFNIKLLLHLYCFFFSSLPTLQDSY